MKNQFRTLILGIVLCFIEILVATPTSNVSIEQSIKSISQTVPGIFGISALHLESGKSIEINAHQRFPMASTYKLPIVIYFLSLIDSGKIDAQAKATITKNDIRRFCFVSPGQCMSCRELMKLMMENSDNATSDIILKMAGGGNKVTQWFHKQNINDISVNRSTLKMMADYSGTSSKNFYTDQRDTVTPNAMVDILRQLYQGKLISQSSTSFLLDSMLKYTRAKNRIVRFLPKKTKVWHKSGTVDGIVSDVGIDNYRIIPGPCFGYLYQQICNTHGTARNDHSSDCQKTF